LLVDKTNFPLLAWLIFVGAAALEVGGDAVVRKGLKGSSLVWIVGGCLMLGGYGLVVNMVKWDFSKLLGVYVAIFALISILAGRFVFGEQVPVTTWVGLGIIILGGLVIQFGGSLPF
jgi:multidrug transporter EmrE-like cation transporter